MITLVSIEGVLSLPETIAKVEVVFLIIDNKEQLLRFLDLRGYEMAKCSLDKLDPTRTNSTDDELVNYIGTTHPKEVKFFDLRGVALDSIAEVCVIEATKDLAMEALVTPSN